MSCWGSNTYGQTTAPSGTFIQLSSGAYHTCALRIDDVLVCWGAGSTSAAWPHYGQSPQPAITPATLPDGQPTDAYSQQLAFGGPSTGIVYSLSSGSLPSPLTLSSAGLISGTPTATSSTAITIRPSMTLASPPAAPTPW